MAIHRGIQSAIFYYLSCAPCADARYRRKRKQEAALSRAERLALEEEESNVYRHPGEPSSTNPHWQSEIALGPTLASRGKRKGNNGTGSKRVLQPGRFGSDASNVASSVDLPHRTASNDSRWNYRPYQREDDDLGRSISNLDGSQYSGNPRKPERAKTADSSKSTGSSYCSTRNPPINDMHPATVTKVTSREDVMWMMQPLPVADVMNGKERVSRSRSDSGGSRMSPAGTNLSRQVSHRLMDQKLRSGACSATPMSRENSNRTVTPNGQRHDRIEEHDFAHGPPKDRRRPTPIAIVNDDSEDSAVTVVHNPQFEASKPQPRRAASRPQLYTIASDDTSPASPLPESGFDHTGRENEIPTPTQSSDESSANIENLTRRSTIAMTEKLLQPAPVATQGKTFVAHHKHADSELSIRPELIDSWYTPEFELPKWVHEHTKREVRKRWSMDL